MSIEIVKCDITDENNIKTIAIPCIGMGIYGCPIELGRDYAFEMDEKVEKNR